MDRISIIQRKFGEQDINAKPSWLEECISWFIAEDPSMSIETLYKRTYDQWLLGDLVEVSAPCLPDSLFTDRKDAFELHEKLVLQMNFVLDISESPYDQLRVLENRVLDATDEEKIEQRQKFKKNRMLKLELTDGARTVVAMEHQSIAALSTKLVPGCKVRLSGPLRVINRILFLTPGTIQVLGGELDSLLITNAYENVLLRKLDKPTKSTPTMNYVEPSVVESNQNSRTVRNNTRPADFSRPTAHDPFDDAMDEDFLDMAMARVEENQSRASEPISSSGTTQSSSAPAAQERMRELLPDLHDFIDTSMLLNDDDPFDVAAIQSAMEKNDGEIFSAGYEFQFESAYLSTIDQIQEKDIERLTAKMIIVKAKFEVVVEKLRFIGDSGHEATMSIILQDSWSRGKLRVQVASKVIDKLLIYDTKELREMFKNLQRQPQVRDEIQVALDDLKGKIQNLNGFIRVTYTMADGFVMLEMLSASPELNSKFASKIKKERLVVIK